MLKKILASFVMLLLLTNTAFATTLEIKIEDKTLKMVSNYVSEEKVLNEAPYISDEGRTMVPIRAISEAFGATVNWIGEEQKVLINKDDTEISLIIGKKEATVNEKILELDSVPTIKNGSTFVPLRFISEALLYKVNFVTTAKKVIIDDTMPIVKYNSTYVTFSEIETLYNIYLNTVKNDETFKDIGEDEITSAVINAVLNEAADICVIYDVFPNGTYSKEDCEYLLEESKSVDYGAKLKGSLEFAVERNYYIQGVPILRYYMESADVNKIYEKEYICAKHILVKNKEVAEKVLEKIASGEDFDALIKEYGIDPGMENYPEGYVFKKGEMVKTFEEEAFRLEENETSQIVESEFGFHIIKKMPRPHISEETKINIAKEIMTEKLEEVGKAELLVDIEELTDMLKKEY